MGKASRRKRDKEYQAMPISPTPQLSYKQVIKRNLCPACLFIAATIFGFGGESMSSGSMVAPWLISIGGMLVAVAIITNQDFESSFRHIERGWARNIIHISLCVLLTIPTFFIFQNMANNEREQLAKTPIFYGELTPGNGPNPYSYYEDNPENMQLTPIPPDSLRVMFGDNSGFYIDSSVETNFGLDGYKFLTIRTDENGMALINTEVYDSTNHKIVKIIDNEFQANPEYAFHPIQTDKHSLIVRDSEGIEVLNIKYINSHTIWIIGRFYFKGKSEAIAIKPSGEIKLKGLTWYGGYLVGGSPGGFINIGSR
jgi:hypothetical protein